MSYLYIRVTGEPKGTPRTKARSVVGHARVYTPATADDWKGNVMREAIAAGGRTFFHDRNEAVRVEMAFLFRRPASHYGKKGLKPSAPAHYTKKPDADNAAKGVLDALVDCGTLFDDAPVVDLFISKQWADGEELPGVEIELRKLEVLE